MYLTRQQSAILDYLSAHIDAHGYAPTFEEIARQFGFRSKGTVYKHIQALKAKGAITQAWNRVRAIEIRGDQDEGRLPVLGLVAAGRPIEALENPEWIQLSGGFMGTGEQYVLRVRGDSMIEQQIADGDYVIVDRSRVPRDGDTVVALIDRQSATIKRLYRHPQVVELRPANQVLKSTFHAPDSVEFNGVVVGVLRKY